MSRLPGTLYLIDTSAAARMHTHPSVKTIIEDLIDEGVAATCVTVDLEAGYSVKDPHDVGHVHSSRDQYLNVLDISEAIAQRARDVQVMMASRGLHRAAGAFDLLTAAVAEHYRAIVLHYDADFEYIASVTGQRQQWIVPQGSIN